MDGPGENQKYKDVQLAQGLLELLEGSGGVPRRDLALELRDLGLDWIPETDSFNEELPGHIKKLRAAGTPVYIEDRRGVDWVVIKASDDPASERFLTLTAPQAAIAMAVHEGIRSLDLEAPVEVDSSVGLLKAYVPRDEIEFVYGGNGTLVRGCAYEVRFETPDRLVSVLTDEGPFQFRIDAISELRSLGTSTRTALARGGRPKVREPVGVAPGAYREVRRPGRRPTDAGTRDIRRIMHAVLTYGSPEGSAGALSLPTPAVAAAVGLPAAEVREKFEAVGPVASLAECWYDDEDDSLCVMPDGTWARRFDGGQALLFRLRLGSLDALSRQWSEWLPAPPIAREQVDDLATTLDEYLSAATIEMPEYPCGEEVLAQFVDENEYQSEVSVAGRAGRERLWIDRLECRCGCWFLHGRIGRELVDGLDLAAIEGVHES